MSFFVLLLNIDTCASKCVGVGGGGGGGRYKGGGYVLFFSLFLVLFFDGDDEGLSFFSFLLRFVQMKIANTPSKQT